MAEVVIVWRYVVYNPKHETWTYTEPHTNKKFYSSDTINWFSVDEIAATLNITIKGGKRIVQ